MSDPKVGSWHASSTSLGEVYDLLLLDLDGVVYIGRRAVPGAVENLAVARQRGLGYSFVTNNASRPPQVVAAHLRELGLDAADDQVVTSAQEGAELMAGRVPSGSAVLAIGGPGVAVALQEVGLAPVTEWAAGVAGVLQGFGAEVGWRELAEASYAVTAGAAWVATNPDLTVPTPRGTAPGNGQLAAVVQRTTGVDPAVTGKPGRGLFDLAIRRAGAQRSLVVGDRLDTDIAGAVNAGLDSMLVLTGVTDLAGLLAAGRGERPTYLARDLGGLWTSHPDVVRQDGWWTCAGARARVLDAHLEVAGEPSADSDLAAVRAAASAVWEAAEAGDQVDLAAAVDQIQRHDG